MGNNSIPSEKNDSRKHKVSDNSAASLQYDVPDPQNYHKYTFLQSLTDTVLLDTTGRIIAANKAFEKLFGIPAEVLKEYDHSFITDPELISKGISEMIIQCIQQKMTAELTGEFDIPEAAKHPSFKHINKEKLFLHARFTPHLNESGDVEAIVLQPEDLVHFLKLFRRLMRGVRFR